MYLETHRLRLQPILRESLDDLVELLTDSIVKQTYMVPDFADRQAAVALAQRIMAMSERKAKLVAGIYLGGQFVGILNETESTEERIELGYALLPRFHNRGFGTEALRGAIEHCFGCGIREVAAAAFEENAASIRVMIKSGMKETGVREQIYYRGKEHLCIYYAIKQE